MRLAAVVMVILFMGCAGVQPAYNTPCTIYEDFGATPENSLIAAKIANPCAAQRLLATAAKLPAVWAQKDYIEKFNKWSGIVHNAIAQGITYQALQDMVVMEVAKLNKEAGMTLLILGDGLLVFGEIQTPISPVDQKMLLASLNDLRVQVARLSLMGM
jgi:hypothetical protein